MPISVLCGDEVIKASVETTVSQEAPNIQLPKQWYLLIDKPSGWASLPHPTVDFERCIIYSDNYCPTYQLDLLGREPAALLPFESRLTLLALFEMLKTGIKPYPKVTTPLTPAERQTLHFVAQGLSNKAVATRRNVTERTVKNVLNLCYQKLNLHSRVQIAHYYYGNWHLLRNWTPPEHVLQGTLVPTD